MTISNNEFPFLDHSEFGPRRVSREIFTNPELFELEFSRIWEKIWVYAAHESEISKPRSFVTRWVGRVPVIVNRNKKGEINAFVNVCTHRGATLCRVSKGTRANFVCPFHGWAFDDNGSLTATMNEEQGGYPEGFDKKKLGLRRLKVANYKGFIFVTLNEEAEAIDHYLADAKTFVDILVEQSPDGLEVLKGVSTYTFNGNWKLQAENGVDGYHVAATHGNYVQTLQNRANSNTKGQKTKVMNVGDLPNARGGYYDLGNGHTVIWSDWTNPQDRPLYPMKEELKARIGEAKANWAVGRLRNLLIYPNVFFMDQTSSQIRVFRPLAVDKTEVTIYCFAPKGEEPAARAHRIRQYEDFFNASGMATPDDLTEFSEVQKGCRAHSVARWSDMSRGMTQEIKGPDDLANELGISPASSGSKIEDEGIFLAQHLRWLELMGFKGE
ncbi:Rieske 2Fe-2S domain-containing protein [Pseudomonas sp. MAP12]|uniref:Rieske 2Fe-2S domain-containing protein n=1 Tax=Geopseudomonas aromaticivorans TaxID=2849492 RepID=A0ABS6MY74_9GAMM|nr:Rieske 2Fe-2S domain-containing protein [Pseudomonas aromaticivorans]MBV2133339.1 Rieske 2Fe-2S domain-containing protein [Pseudomonas aromaticivorans]